MRIAISTDGEFVSAHFGRCPTFSIIEIENGKIVKQESIENPGHQPGFIPQFLHQKGVACIICGGMGRRATSFFSEYGIQTIVGVSGTVAETLQKLQDGTLEGGESLCKPGSGKGYGLDKTECDHPEHRSDEH
jgi:predicted Fe-Mo cluster-binding NifX family protein